MSVERLDTTAEAGNLTVSLSTLFSLKCSRSRCRSRWGKLDRGRNRFQPIKFVNLVALGPCETPPYNKYGLLIRLFRSRYLNIDHILFFVFSVSANKHGIIKMGEPLNLEKKI